MPAAWWGAALAVALVGAPGEAPKKVAILDLSVSGMEEEVGRKRNDAVIGVMAAAIGRLGHTVISTSDIRAMLGFERQKALLGCESDTSCIAEIGGALGVDLIVSGTLGELGGTFNLSLTLLASDQAKVEARFTGTAGSEAALPATAERGVEVLFGARTDLTGTGMLLVKTDPPGARVKVDGKDQGPAPVSVEIAGGEHEIEASLGELTGKATVGVKPGGVTRHELLLRTPPVPLRVNSDPPEATVWLDGERVGTTPLILDAVPSGRRRLRVELSGHVPWEEDVDLTITRFEASGREPFKHDITLPRRWPVTPGVWMAAVTDVQGVTDGVTYAVELTADFGRYVQLGAGLAVPGTWLGTLRVFFYRNGFEIAGFVRGGAVTLGGTEAVEPKLAGFAGGGLTLGYGIESPIGVFAIRAEGGYSYELSTLEGTIPVGLGVGWSYQ